MEILPREIRKILSFLQEISAKIYFPPCIFPPQTAHLDHSLYKPQVGIHPWYVTENMVEDLGDGNSEWVGKMREILRENPSFGVGEIGIDKIRAKKVGKIF